jgi:hypothetical protein
MQYGPGDLAKVTEVYDVDPDNWKNQRMLAPSSRPISADELAEAMRSMTPRQYRVITGEEQPPAPPAEQQDESPEVLSADERIRHLEKCILSLVADNLRFKGQMERLNKLQLPALCTYLNWPQQ